MLVIAVLYFSSESARLDVGVVGFCCMEGITVSIIAIRVSHCESVKGVTTGPAMCGVGIGASWDSMVL